MLEGNLCLKDKAESFVNQMYDELNLHTDALRIRIEEVSTEIESTGTYTQRLAELEYGVELLGGTLIVVSVDCFGKS